MRLLLLCAILLAVILSAQQNKQAPDPRSLVLQGDRFKSLKYDDATPEQKKMIDSLLAGDRRGAKWSVQCPVAESGSGQLCPAIRRRGAIPQ